MVWRTGDYAVGIGISHCFSVGDFFMAVARSYQAARVNQLCLVGS